MVKDGELRLTRITNNKLEKFRLNFVRFANRIVALLMKVILTSALKCNEKLTTSFLIYQLYGASK